MTVYADLAGIEIGDGFPVRLLGAINISPESFYKGSIASTEDVLRRQAERMAAEGADMIDVGAMSSAPYLETEVSEAEEIERLVRAVRVIRKTVDVPISVDTTRSRVAISALDVGAAIVNDISGFRNDPAMAEVAARRSAGAILMASEASPGAQHPMPEVLNLLRHSLTLAKTAGFPEGRVVIDPGIGFFRKAADPWDAWDCAIIRRLADLRELGRPILIGLSRKSFIGKILERPDPGERLAGSLAATAIAVVNGAHMVRTHDVGSSRDAIRVAEALRPR